MNKKSRVLIVITLVFTMAVLVITGLLFYALQEEARTIRAAEHQMLRQAGSEIFKLQISVERYHRGENTQDDMFLYYDILYSRAKLFEARRIEEAFESYGDKIFELNRMIHEIEPILNNISSPEDENLTVLVRELNILQKTWENTSLLIFQAAIEEANDAKQGQLFLASLLGISLVSIGISVYSLIFILFKQMSLRRDDLRRERHLTTKLVATTKAVEAASMAKSDFLQTMSHELRTPLNAISGFSQVLETTDLSDKQKEYITYVRRASDNLSTLIGDVLDYVDIEADSFECIYQEIEIGLIMSDLRLFCERYIEQVGKNLSLVVEVDDHVPRTVTTDHIQLNRVLAHIGTNAVKFSSEGKIIIRLSVVEKQDEDFLQFEIEDFGVGIEDKFKQSIFEAFSQVDQSYSRTYEGTGLGLAICKKLVDILHGQIGVRSKIGEGSTFWVCIPVEAQKNGLKK